jgi:hypothetical protein
MISSILALLNHLIRPCQHVRRYRQADLFGGFQIDDQLELFRLLHRQISWLVPFKILSSYGTSFADLERRAAVYVASFQNGFEEKRPSWRTAGETRVALAGGLEFPPALILNSLRD